MISLARLPNTRLKPVYAIALVLLALVALIYVVAALPIESLSELRLRHLPWWFFPVIVLLHVTYLLLSAEVWRRMLRRITGTGTAYPAAYSQMAAVAIGKYIPGKIWGFVARTGQLHRHDVPAGLSVFCSIVEQILVLAGGAIVVVSAGFIAFPEYTSALVLLGAILLVGLVVISARLPAIVRWLRRRQADANIADNATGFGLIGFLQFAAAYAVLWLISGLILSVIFFSLFDAVANTENIAALVLANTLGFIVGFFAVFAPGGLGVREATTVAILAPFLPLREVLIAAIALRTVIVLFDGVNAVIMLIGESRQAAKDIT